MLLATRDGRLIKDLVKFRVRNVFVNVIEVLLSKKELNLGTIGDINLKFCSGFPIEVQAEPSLMGHVS